MAASPFPRFCTLVALVGLACVSTRVDAQNGAAKLGIEKRVPWTTSRVKGSPEPPLPYITERVFPALKFNQCVDIATPPGSDHLFVVEQSGKMFSFANRPEVEKADLVVDIAKSVPGARNVYALTFHPEFQQNRYCYVCYVKADDLPDGTHIARFEVKDTNPPTIDAASEKTIITWLSGGHNGCCLKFGPDGCLYISTGDAGPANPPDPRKTGQDVSDLLSAILRIDVDHAEEGKGYRVPADNPFVGIKDVRPEIWAYGLRNPWRMSFDPKTGDLWVGGVGWELWEMLYRIERGGNYGWAVMEGRQTTHTEWPRGPTAILPPTIDHLHTESTSITDGLTYTGTRLKDLQGMHIYGDYDTGKIWGFRWENGKVVGHRELADSTLRIVGFGAAPDGEALILDHIEGTIQRLTPNPQPNTTATFPRKLGDTGLFAAVNKQSPAPGVIPYSINAEPWADHAVAQRWVAVPGDQSIKTQRETWSFPKDTVLVKSLSLDLQQGDPASRKLIETQILHFDGRDWMPYTYQWNDEQTDALLVEAGGAQRSLEVVDPQSPGGKRTQVWRFAGRGECQRCHNLRSGPPLAFNAAQLRKVHQYDDLAPQLETLAHVKIVDKTPPRETGLQLAALHDPATTIDGRARAYLHVNCAHCHRLHAGGAVLSQMHFDVPLDKATMVNVRPTQGTFGIHAAQVIAPGDPFRSVLWYRMAKLGGGRMPHVGSSEVDQPGLALIHDWIRELPRAGSEAAAVPTADLAVLEKLRTLDAGTEQAAQLNQLLSSTSGALRLLRSVDKQELPAAAVALAIEKGSKHSDPSVRDLFERFLPLEQRIQRLGSAVRPDQILALSGDAARGQKIFFETATVSCQNCHRIGPRGKEIGPDLTAIGKKLGRLQMLESILEPSKLIEPKFVTHLAETKDGRLITGLLVEKDAEAVVLKDAQDKLTRLAVKDVEQLVPQRQSLMPDLLLRDMTAQQAADLLEYLSSLK